MGSIRDNLGLKIIQASTGNQLTPFNGIYFTVQDSISTIRNKITASSKEPIITSSFVSLSDSKNNYYNTELDENIHTVYYHNIVDHVKFADLIKNPYKFIDQGSPEFNNYYSKFSKIFNYLEKEDLIKLIDFVLYNGLPDLFQELKESSKRFEKDVGDQKKDFIKKYSFIKQKVPTSIANKLIEPGINSKYKYSLLSSIVYINVSKSPIDIYKVIKDIKLSQDLPLAHTVDEHTFKAIIKIYKNTSKAQAEEWLLNTRNGNGNINLKRPKGLTFKVLTSSGEYLNVLLSKKDPRITVRCNWSIDDNSTLSDISDCIKNVDNLANQIRRISGDEMNLTRNFSIKYAKIFFQIKINLSIKKIMKNISKVNNLKLQENSSAEGNLKLVYIPMNYTIIIRENKGQGLNIHISGPRNENNVDDTIDEILYLIMISLEGKEIPKNTKVDIKISPEKLRDFGIVVDVIGCQKNRRPRILKKTEHASTYHIVKDEIKIGCNDDKKYKYPGYTVKNVVCCFSKDQRDKEVFKRNEIIVEKTPRKIILIDEKILAKPVIITEKILEEYRLGIIPKILEKYFTDEFNRIGTSYIGGDSLLSAVNYCIKSELSRNNIIESINLNLFLSLENGEIKKKFETMTKYRDYIRLEPNLDHSYLLDLLQDTLKINILVISKNKISCLNYSDFPYSNFILLYKNKGNYEPLVKTIDYRTLQKKFKEQEISQFINIYNESCQINYIAINVAPPSFNKILSSGIKIIGQVVNAYNNISFLHTEFGILPILPRIKAHNIPEIKLNTVLKTAKAQIKLLSKTKIPQYAPISQIINEEKETIGILTKSRIVIPTKPSSPESEVPIISDIQAFTDINDIIHSSGKNSELRKDFAKITGNLELYQRFRYTVSENLKGNPEIKILLKNIKESTSIIFSDKVNFVRKIIKELLDDQVLVGTISVKPVKNIPTVRRICKKIKESCQIDPYCVSSNDGNCLLYIENDKYPKIIKRLALEILSSMDILNSTIRAEFLDKSDFIKRDNEIVLLTKEDIQHYFRKSKIS